MDVHALQLKLLHCVGTSKLTRHNLVRNLLLSEGAILLADEAGAYWLLDAIASWQIDARARAEPFQTWDLRVDTTTRSAVLSMTDGNTMDAIIRQEIEWTDFPLDGMTLWLVVDGDIRVMLLPGEY